MVMLCLPKGCAETVCNVGYSAIAGVAWMPPTAVKGPTSKLLSVVPTLFRGPGAFHVKRGAAPKWPVCQWSTATRHCAFTLRLTAGAWPGGSTLSPIPLRPRGLDGWLAGPDCLAVAAWQAGLAYSLLWHVCSDAARCPLPAARWARWAGWAAGPAGPLGRPPSRCRLASRACLQPSLARV
jgi:hypothetical protein